ncbi:MAG: ABC transporter ATP-binding protein [Mycobacteriales bacterium]
MQAAERASRLQELLSAHVTRISSAAMTLAQGLSGALSFLAFVISAVVVTPYAVLIIVLGTLLFGSVIVPLTRLTRRRSQLQAGLNTAYAASVSQVVGCAKETRVFGVTEVVQQALADQSRRTAAAAYRTRLLARMTPVVYQSVALLVLVLSLASAYAADVGGIGDLSAVIVLLVRAIGYGQQVNTAIQQAGEVAPYLADVLASEQAFRAAQAMPGAAPTPNLQRISFEGVSYRYPTGEEVLHDLTFTVDIGQKIGIVGPSGSGKSTLVQLLLRLREPTRGTISVNGHDVRDFDFASWFHHMSLVPQDNVLLPGTIADNIRFYRPDVADDAVIEAAGAAHLHDFLLSLPAGYRTLVGPGHQDLSGGQRQRLGLARALLARPDVIVLDEPTSALDMDSELLVQETLQSLGRRVTLFIVAHRLSTLADCDAVMVLEQGRVVAFGDHTELLAANAFYSRAVQLSGLQP